MAEVDEEQRAVELAHQGGGSNRAVASGAAAEEEQRRPLVKPRAPPPAAAAGDCGFVQRLVATVDERVSVKLLVRLWGPRLELLVRLMLVATFLDDSLRTAARLPDHVRQVGEGWLLGWLAALSPAAADVAAGAILAAGLVAQLGGSICLLALVRPVAATKALVGWAAAQPLLYGQLSNLEFMSESLSLIGGLLMLHVHLGPRPGPGEGPDPSAGTDPALVQLLGRLLLPAVYVHRAGVFFSSAFSLDETTDLGAYLASLSAFTLQTAALVVFAAGCALVAAGLRSRTVALALALVNVAFVCVQHPLFRFLRYADGKWTVDEDQISMPSVVLPKDMDVTADPWEVYDLHRYYFFLGLSTSGALLLLAQLGPGGMALQRDEKLLPVTRAQD